ncbi:unnamed protein product [Brassicogethes aeneus]|uniref:Peptidase S1 domain-containing protein n=1 Tax=Brassicogethes aeneus TaxID=1431903 RepID=A0A9P0B0E9_BRAAE|nr:unnamed protein product [Brassicogethes aeneus]
MGVWNPSLTINTVSSTVAKIEVHPFFNPLTLKNDIAVLRLVTPMTRSAYINTACMPLSGSTSATFVGQRCVVSGWGQTSFFINNAPTNLMKQVFVNVVDYTTCRTSFSAANLLSTNVDTYLDGNGEICAGGESQKDACSQDGGSPLVCQDTSGVYRVAGLVIWGKNCGQPGVYGVYVSIPAYYNWIETKIQTLNAEFG